MNNTSDNIKRKTIQEKNCCTFLCWKLGNVFTHTQTQTQRQQIADCTWDAIFLLNSSSLLSEFQWGHCHLHPSFLMSSHRMHDFFYFCLPYSFHYSAYSPLSLYFHSLSSSRSPLTVLHFLIYLPRSLTFPLTSLAAVLPPPALPALHLIDIWLHRLICETSVQANLWKLPRWAPMKVSKFCKVLQKVILSVFQNSWI